MLLWPAAGGSRLAPLRAAGCSGGLQARRRRLAVIVTVHSRLLRICPCQKRKSVPPSLSCSTSRRRWSKCLIRNRRFRRVLESPLARSSLWPNRRHLAGATSSSGNDCFESHEIGKGRLRAALSFCLAQGQLYRPCNRAKQSTLEETIAPRSVTCRKSFARYDAANMHGGDFD